VPILLPKKRGNFGPRGVGITGEMNGFCSAERENPNDWNPTWQKAQYGAEALYIRKANIWFREAHREKEGKDGSLKFLKRGRNKKMTGGEN